jgi:hypothetical protein
MPPPTNTVDDVAAYLVAQGLGTLVAGTWQITKRQFSETQDKNIMVSPGAGAAPITASQTKAPGIDIYVRGVSDGQGDAETKSREILDALAYLDETRLAGASGTLYNMVRSVNSEPIFMGRDAPNQRPVYLVSFQALRSTINSGA